MTSRPLRPLGNQALLTRLATLVARDCGTTAEMHATVAEIDFGKLHRQAGYPSTYRYLVGMFHMADGAAYERIYAGRAAQRHPAIPDAVAKGRLHLSAVVLLAPYLSEANTAELIAEATHKTKIEIERLLAARFPKPDLPSVLRAIPAGAPAEHAPGQVAAPSRRPSMPRGKVRIRRSRRPSMPRGKSGPCRGIESSRGRQRGSASSSRSTRTPTSCCATCRHSSATGFLQARSGRSSSAASWS
jgi:hypothetical protein